jgi:hypothetical protein
MVNETPTYKGYMEAPAATQEMIDKLLERASREIADYTAIFVFDRGVGSGTFVNTNGVNGILTAHHVAKAVLNGKRLVHLCISTVAHRTDIRAEFFEHVVIGNSTDKSRPEAGPDLSFLRIRDVQLLGVIRA